jgi:hypothetical protein
MFLYKFFLCFSAVSSLVFAISYKPLFEYKFFLCFSAVSSLVFAISYKPLFEFWGFWCFPGLNLRWVCVILMLTTIKVVVVKTNKKIIFS